MRYETYGNIASSVRKDLGLEQEDFVSPSELMGYCNDAIDDAESEIHTLYEDYFKKYSRMSLVANQAEYSLPSDIYANKIRGVIYNYGGKIYTVKRYVETQTMFEDMEVDANSTVSEMKYTLINSSAELGVQMVLIPAPKNDEANAVKISYLRNANRMVDDNSICDIPEFIDYVKQYMKVRCYEKEGHPNLSFAVTALEYKKMNMMNTLNNMIPDGDNLLEKDVSFYWEMGEGITINQ